MNNQLLPSEEVLEFLETRLQKNIREPVEEEEFIGEERPSSNEESEQENEELEEENQELADFVNSDSESQY